MTYYWNQGTNRQGLFESELLDYRVLEVENEAGPFLVYETRTRQVELTFPEVDSLLRDLCLLYGIGEATAFRLQQEGYHTIADLVNHPKWRKAALDLLKTIDGRDLVRLAHYGASDFQLLSFFRPEAVQFIDIETVGLYYIHPVFLIGILQFEAGQGWIKQFLAKDFTAEKAILFEVFKMLNQAEVLVSFNGRSFDLPYLKGRMRFHNLSENFDLLHLDLLRQARRNYKGVLPNCRLLTIEKCLLQQERTDDIPGAEIAQYYYNFLDTGDLGYLRPILKHNAEDLFSMAKFLGLLTSNNSEKAGR